MGIKILTQIMKRKLERKKRRRFKIRNTREFLKIPSFKVTWDCGMWDMVLLSSPTRWDNMSETLPLVCCQSPVPRAASRRVCGTSPLRRNVGCKESTMTLKIGNRNDKSEREGFASEEGLIKSKGIERRIFFFFKTKREKNNN